MQAQVWGLLLIAAAVALAGQSAEEPDLGEGVSMETSVAEPPPPPPKPLVMRTVDVDALKIIDHYKDFNQKLQKQEGTLRQKLGSPPEESKGIGFVAVPGYKYAYQGRTIEDKSRAECETVCATYGACQSYSYNAEKRSCIWSMSHITYDASFTMFAKDMTPDGHFHTHLYNRLPGVVVQEKKHPPMRDTTIEECKYECTKDESCKSFSWSADRRECIKSSIPLHYNAEWTYYEKDIPQKKTKKSKHKKENERKEKRKSAWIKASTGGDRDQIKREMKLTENLERAREVAQDAERVEKAARRDMTFNQKKCVLLSGMGQGAMKRSMHMMDILSDRQLSAVKKQATAEKMAKNAMMQVRKEGLQKAKLEAKLTKAKSEEADEKVVGVKKLEHDEKLIAKQGKERTTKACEKDIETQAFFAEREGHMKNTEAEAKRMQIKKDIAFARKEYHKASQYQEVKQSEEKAAKKVVEVQRSGVENAMKKEQKADQERDRKFAMDEQEQYEGKLHVAESEERDKRHDNMIAMEKRTKAKAKKDDLQENGAKDAKVEKGHKKEMDMKATERKKEKQQKIKEKREAEEVVQKKAEKNKELSAKRAAQQALGVGNAMNTLQSDEDQAQSDIAKEEKNAQSVTSQAEAGTKSDKKNTDSLAKIEAQEKETKNKVREEHTRKENLLQQLKNTQNEASQATARESAAAEAAMLAKDEQKRFANEVRNAKDPEHKAVLLAKEKFSKQKEISYSHKADKSAKYKADTALAQEEQADSLQAGACISICIEGKDVREHDARVEKEEKIRAKAAAAGAPLALELGDGNDDLQPMALLETEEGDNCEPSGISVSQDGACSSAVSPQMAMDACQTYLGQGACESICEQKATTIQDQEASCKKNMQNPLEAQLNNAQLPSEDSAPVSDPMRSLYEENEKARKEIKVKEEAAKPVPEEMPMPVHAPFTYRGCEC